MYGDFPADNTVYTPYIPINAWLWPTLHMSGYVRICQVRGDISSTEHTLQARERECHRISKRGIERKDVTKCDQGSSQQMP
jgi:hypothetical protein